MSQRIESHTVISPNQLRDLQTWLDLRREAGISEQEIKVGPTISGKLKVEVTTPNLKPKEKISYYIPSKTNVFDL